MDISISGLVLILCSKTEEWKLWKSTCNNFYSLSDIELFKILISELMLKTHQSFKSNNCQCDNLPQYGTYCRKDKVRC